MIQSEMRMNRISLLAVLAAAVIILLYVSDRLGASAWYALLGFLGGLAVSGSTVIALLILLRQERAQHQIPRPAPRVTVLPPERALMRDDERRYWQ